jgi:hypothetical protein
MMLAPLDMRPRLVRTDRVFVWRPWRWHWGRYEVSPGVMWVQRGPFATRYEAEFCVVPL